MFVWFLGLLSSIHFFSAYAQEDITYVEISAWDLRPTQFHVGMYEVKIKATEFDEMSKSERKKFLWKKPIQVVYGPNDEVYIVDGHHQARALLETGREYLWAEVLADYSELSEKEFYRRMKQRHWMFLFDYELNEERSPNELPHDLSAMRDDPYRSLAWLVRKKGGYKNLDIPFQEFFWAEFFRKHIPDLGKNPNTHAAMRRAMKTAYDLAKSDLARDLPGYGRVKAEPLMARCRLLFF